MRQMGLALKMYSNDYKDVLITLDRPMRPPPFPISPITFWVWDLNKYNRLPEVTPANVEDIWPLRDGGTRIFQCPSQKDEFGFWGAAVPYAMNIFTVSIWNYGTRTSHQTLWKWSKIPRKSEMIYVAEAMDTNGALVDNRLLYSGGFLSGGDPSYFVYSRNWGQIYDYPTATRHAKGGNLLFFDNSVRHMTFEATFPMFGEATDGTNPKNRMWDPRIR
jgi:prepilin-type processing-associated H-X9-DG protein